MSVRPRPPLPPTDLDAPAASDAATATIQRRPRQAAVASFVGSTLEYYDFFIYGSASALVFSHVFFPGIDGRLGTVLSMATIGVGYVVRPLAAGLIGHFGDRVGRKRMLVLTLVMMGIATFVIGCLPSSSAIGAAAPILLVLCRVLQGVSAAGESTGAVTMALEHAPDGRRAFYGSWVNTGAVAGILLASTAFLIVSRMPQDSLLSWGWRIPFWASILVTITGLVIRATLPEAPAFAEEAARTPGSVRSHELPVKTVLRDHWRSVLKVVAFGVWAVVSSVFSAYSIAFGTAHGLSASLMFTVIIVTGGLGLITQPLFGVLADRIGRKPVFVVGNVVVAVSIFGYFWAIEAAAPSLVFLFGILVMSVGYGMVNPLGPSMIAEMFPTRVRYSGAAISSQLGLVVTGFAPAIAAAIVQPGPGGWIPVAVFTAACSLVSAVITMVFIKETFRTPTHELGGVR